MPGTQDIIEIIDRQQVQSDINFTIEEIERLDTTIKSFAPLSLMGKNGTASDFRKQSTDMAAAMEKMQQMQQKLMSVEKELEAVRTKNNDQRKARTQDELKAIVTEQVERQKNIASIKDEIKLRDAQTGSIIQQRIQLKQLQAQYDALSADQKKQPIGVNLHADIQSRDKQLKAEEGGTGRFQRNVGDYIGAVKILEKELVDVKNKMDSLTRAGNGNGEEMDKLKHQYQSLQTLTSQQSKGFASLTMEIRNGERALFTMREAGLEGTEGFEQMQLSVAKAHRELNEFNKSQKLLESAAPGLQALTTAAKGLGGAYAVGKGAAALFADGDEKVEKELNKLVAIMTVLQGLNEVHELLERKGAIATLIHAGAIKIKNFVMGDSVKSTKEATLATEANTVAEEEGTVAATEASTAITILGISLRTLFIATGIGAILVLLPLLAEAFSKVGESAKKAGEDAEKLRADQEQMEEVTAKAIDNYAEEETHVKLVVAQLKDENISRAEKTKLIDELKDKYADYVGDVKNEGKYTKELADAINEKLIPAIILEGKAKAAEAIIAKKSEEQMEIQLNLAKNGATWYDKLAVAIGAATSSGSLMAMGLTDAIKNGKKDIDDLQEDIDRASKIYLDLEEQLSKKGKGTHKDDNDDEKSKEDDYAKFLLELQDKLNAAKAEGRKQDLEDYATNAKAIADDEKKTLSQRLDALQLYNEAKAAIVSQEATDAKRELQKEHDEAILDFKKRKEDLDALAKKGQNVAPERKLLKSAEVVERELEAAKLQDIDKKKISSLNALAVEGMKNYNAIIKSGLDQEAKDRMDAFEQRLSEEEADYQTQLASFNQDELDELKAAGKNEEKKKSIVDKYNKEKEKQALIHNADMLKIEIKQTQDLLDQYEIRAQASGDKDDLKRVQDAKSKIAKLQAQLSDVTIKINLQVADKIDVSKELKMIADIKNAYQEVYGVIDGIVKLSAEKRIAAIEKEMKANDVKYSTEEKNLQNSTLNEQQKQAALRRLDAESAQQKAALMRKERDEKRKEAEWNKANSIAQIILNTAQAVAKTYAEAGFFGGLAGAIAVGAIGAAELGIAIATPIPQFEKGTDYKPTSGPMIVGEKGSELMITPSGKQVLTPDKPTLMYGERGTKIIPHDEVNRMLLRDIYQQTAMHIEKNNDKKFDELKEAVVLGSQAQVSAMKKIRNSIIVNVDSGLQAHYKKLRS